MQSVLSFYSQFRVLTINSEWEARVGLLIVNGAYHSGSFGALMVLVLAHSFSDTMWSARAPRVLFSRDVSRVSAVRLLVIATSLLLDRILRN